MKSIFRRSLRTMAGAHLWLVAFGVSASAFADENDQALQLMHVAEAQRFSTGSETVSVAIVGTGVNYHLPQFDDALAIDARYVDARRYGYDATAADGVGDPVDTFGAGTFAASLILSIAPKVKIIPVKAFGADGVGNWEQTARAVDYAIERHADVIFLDFGGRGPGADRICREIAAAQTAGILVVTPAGNEGTDAEASYPSACRLPNEISVAATDTRGNLAYYSSYGLRSTHVAAPGNRLRGLGADGLEVSYTGTGGAAAFVAGAAALLKSYRPELNDFARIQAAFQTGADANATLQGKVRSGGTLNLEKLLSAEVGG